jgi:23S rRNA pseudouridine2604 synthase
MGNLFHGCVLSQVMEKVRISKLMAERGLCSRREADTYIERGWVKVDGVVATLGERALATQTITLDRAIATQQTALVTILIHKPMGYVSGQAEDGYTPAVALIQEQNRAQTDRSPIKFSRSQLRGLAVAGRLDIDSTGLLILTQDGRVARQLIGEDSEIEKEYLVRVQGKLAPGSLELLNEGLSLDGKKLKRAQVRWQNDDQLQFILREGKKRQIRRMCELVGLKVLGLKRVRIGRVSLADLPVGQWRYLRQDERF